MNESEDDSGCELEDDDDEARGDALFLGEERGNGKVGAALRLAGKGKSADEVAEAISPGGHVVKRRARTRPLSDELLGSAQSTRKLPEFSVSYIALFYFS